MLSVCASKKERRLRGAANHRLFVESHRSGLNRRPPDYESGALPLSYCGKGAKSPSLPSALERTRTAMPFGTTPSRWRVYQFHHQGNNTAAICDLLLAVSISSSNSK